MRLILSAVFLLIFTYPVCIAGEPKELSVDLALGFSGGLKDGCWAPGAVTIRYTPAQQSQTIDGVITLEFQDEIGTLVQKLTQDLRMGTGTKRMPFLLLPSEAMNCKEGLKAAVTLRDRSGKVLFSSTFLGGRHVLPKEAQVIVCINAQGLLGISRAYRLPTNSSASFVQAVRFDIPEESLPANALAYESVDAIVWYAPDFTKLQPPQRQALESYVRQGGHLVLLESVHALHSNERLDLPADTLGGVERVPLKGRSLEVPQALHLEGIDAVRSAPGASGGMAYRVIRPTHGRSILSYNNQPLIWRQGLGHGRITTCAIDLVAPPLRGSPYSIAVLSLATDIPLLLSQMQAIRGARSHRKDDDHNNYWSYNHPAATAPLQSIFSSAFDISPIPTGYIFLFGFSYLLVIGPISYLVLRARRRLAWSYVVLAAGSILFTAIAYTSAFWIKGSDNHVVDVCVLDHVDDEIYRRHFLSIFSAHTRDSRLKVGDAVTMATLETPMDNQWGYYGNGQPLSYAQEQTFHTTSKQTSPDHVALRQWSSETAYVRQLLPAKDPLDLRVALSFTGKDNAMVALQGEGTKRLPPGNAVLVTAYGLVTWEESPGGRRWIDPNAPVSLNDAFSEIIGTPYSDPGGSKDLALFDRQEERAYEDRSPGARFVLADALRLSFPVLAKPQMNIENLFHSGVNSLSVLRTSKIEYLRQLVLASQVERATSTELPSALNPATQVESIFGKEDAFGLDASRLLGEGGAVLLIIETRAYGELSLDGGFSSRDGYTLHRYFITPEKVIRKRTKSE